jgi:hypothetical protein
MAEAGHVAWDMESYEWLLQGDREPYEQLKGMLVQFDVGFEMMPGAGGADLTPQQKPFQAEEPASSAGG